MTGGFAWALSSPANGTTSSDNTPVVSLTGAAAENGSSVQVYDDAVCSSAQGASQTVTAGATTHNDITYASDGTDDGAIVFYVVMTDAAGNASSCTDVSLGYTLDSAPLVTVEQGTSAGPCAEVQADHETDSDICYDVEFSESVTGFDGSDVTATKDGGALPAGAALNVTGSGANYAVTISGLATDGTDDGDYVVSVLAGGATDSGGNTNLASTSTDNTVSLDSIPTVTVNQASGQADPETDSDIAYDVVFSESVTGFVAGDVTATKDGGALPGGASIGVSGSGATYTVTISGLATDGTDDGDYVVTLAAGVATDVVGNGNLASTSVDNTVTLQNGCYPDAGPTYRVSVDSSGSEANNSSSSGYAGVLSGDGHYVAFYSTATNLVAGDTNGASDIFVRDTVAGTTTRVSVDSSGSEANNGSYDPSFSADGRYVAFISSASNLVAGDTNAASDIFVRDTVAGTTTRVSVDSSGSEANSGSDYPSLSADGRYVAFYSSATNLVAGDTNGASDIFVRDTVAGTTTRVSVDSSGSEGNNDSYYPSLSADGRYVAFYSWASNLVAGDTNGAEDIFVRDTVAGTTTRVSVDDSGSEANSHSYDPSLSADGRYVAFRSAASNLVAGDTNGASDIFVRDTVAGTTTRVSVDGSGSEANSHSYDPSLSADGRYVAFYSWASNLVAGDTNGVGDIFVRDTVASTTTRVSVDSSGSEANGSSDYLSLSADGRYVAFSSGATNLICDDTNGYQDVFVRDLQPTGIAVTVEQDPATSDPTNILPVIFDVSFASPITAGTFTTADIVNLGSAHVVSWSITDLGNDQDYEIYTNDILSSGTVIPIIVREATTDGTLLSQPSTSVDNTVEYILQASSCAAPIMPTCPNSCTAGEIAASPYSGSGTVSDPYLICTPTQFQAIGANLADWNSHFKLKADIDLSGFTGGSYNIIGQPGSPFTGVVDGQGCNISNLSYDNGATNEGLQGIFGESRCAYIHDLKLSNISISNADLYAGALVGYSSRGRYDNIDLSSGTITSNNYAGGLIGDNHGLSFEHEKHKSHRIFNK